MAVASFDLSFLYVDIGHPGSEPDSKIWENSGFKKALDDNTITLPLTPEGSIGYHFIGTKTNHNSVGVCYHLNIFCR